MSVREYLMPRSLPEAIGLLERHGPELLVMAGGTVAMPLINDGISLPERVMSLRHAGLDRLERRGDVLAIGAAVTLSQLLAAGRRAAAQRGRPPHRELVHPQHGHGRRQPLHPAARAATWRSPSWPSTRRSAWPARGASGSSRWPTSSPAS